MSDQTVRPDAPVIPAEQVNPPTADNIIPQPQAQAQGQAGAAEGGEQPVEGDKKPSKKGGEWADRVTELVPP